MFWNEKHLQSFNKTFERTLNTLFKIMNQEKHQQQTLIDFFENEQIDSTMLKTLFMITIICLLATLIAISSIISKNDLNWLCAIENVFQSNLIQTLNSHLVLISQFWIYVAITLSLMLFIVSWIIYVDRVARISVSIKLVASSTMSWDRNERWIIENDIYSSRFKSEMNEENDLEIWWCSFVVWANETLIRSMSVNLSIYFANTSSHMKECTMIWQYLSMTSRNQWENFWADKNARKANVVVNVQSCYFINART